MLARLILALILLSIGTAGIAAPGQCGPEPAAHRAMAADHCAEPAKPDKRKPLTQCHLCIGCIAPATLRAPMLADAPARTAQPVRLSGHRGIPLSPYSPATPPPRSVG